MGKTIVQITVARHKCTGYRLENAAHWVTRQLAIHSLTSCKVCIAQRWVDCYWAKPLHQLAGFLSIKSPLAGKVQNRTKLSSRVYLGTQLFAGMVKKYQHILYHAEHAQRLKD